MLKAEPLIGAARCKSILRRYDSDRPRQPEQGTRPYPKKPSNAAARSIEVRVVIFGQIMSPAFEQSNDLIGWMRADFSSTRNWMAVSGRSGNPFGRFLTPYHGQPNSLSIFEPDLGERLKNSVFVKSFDGFCHGEPR